MNDQTRPDAVEAEATGAATVGISFDGHTYTIPASIDDADINVIRAFEQGHATVFVAELMGADQFALLERRHRKAHDGRFTKADLDRLAEQIAEAYGFEGTGE